MVAKKKLFDVCFYFLVGFFVLWSLYWSNCHSFVLTMLSAFSFRKHKQTTTNTSLSSYISLCTLHRHSSCWEAICTAMCTHVNLLPLEYTLLAGVKWATETQTRIIASTAMAAGEYNEYSESVAALCHTATHNAHSAIVILLSWVLLPTFHWRRIKNSPIALLDVPNVSWLQLNRRNYFMVASSFIAAVVFQYLCFLSNYLAIFDCID